MSWMTKKREKHKNNNGKECPFNNKKMVASVTIWSLGKSPQYPINIVRLCFIYFLGQNPIPFLIKSGDTCLECPMKIYKQIENREKKYMNDGGLFFRSKESGTLSCLVSAPYPSEQHFNECSRTTLLWCV